VIAVPSAIITTALLESETNIQRRLREAREEAANEINNSAQDTKGD